MYTSNSISFIKNSTRKLISDSNTHSGLRVLIAMAATFIPALSTNLLPIFGQSSFYISLSLCLGVMASAIVETDDNYKGRGKFIITIVCCFFIASSSVELLMPYPILFTFGLFISSFAFMMLPVLGINYSKVGFGSILIAIYTMIGHQANISWYEQPLLLSIGVLWYGVFSIIWCFYKPYRSLREQLAQLFFSLSRYQQQKSALFNEQECTSKQGIVAVRQHLAIKNIAIMARFEQSKQILQSRFQVNPRNKELNKLNEYYIIAEQIHERVCASQYLYSQLENSFKKSQILEGFHQLLLQVSDDCYQLGIAINDEKAYQHSRRLKWTIKALADQIYLVKQDAQFSSEKNEVMIALQAIYENMAGVNHLLLNISRNTVDPVVVHEVEEQKKISLFKRLMEAITTRTPVYKHAVRISASLSVAFALQYLFHLPQGFWLLLTVLFVCQPSFSETRKRLIQRSIGTMVGILLGYPILMLVNDSFTQVILLIFSAFLFFNYLRTNYGLAVIFITLFVIFLFNLLTGTGIEILSVRIAETLLGSALSMLAITFIYPDWQFQRFPALVEQLLQLSAQYFKQVGEQYQYDRNENLNYRLIRFKTFKSDAALTSAWQSMLFEPHSKQKLSKEIYTLVNKCDVLVAYIAALASHRHKIDRFANNLELQNLIELTEKQISIAYNPAQINKQVISDNIKAFANYKTDLSGECLLIIEQLQLIAFTALDIQLLLQKVNFQNKQVN